MFAIVLTVSSFLNKYHHLIPALLGRVHGTWHLNYKHHKQFSVGV